MARKQIKHFNKDKRRSNAATSWRKPMKVESMCKIQNATRMSFQLLNEYITSNKKQPKLPVMARKQTKQST
jgi:hypothetical protein